MDDFIIGGVCVLSLILSGLGPTAVAAEKKKYKTFKYACPWGAPNRVTWGLAGGFMKLVEKRSNGRIKFKYYPVCQIVGPKDQLDAAAKGTIDGFQTAMM